MRFLKLISPSISSLSILSHKKLTFKTIYKNSLLKNEKWGYKSINGTFALEKYINLRIFSSFIRKDN